MRILTRTQYEAICDIVIEQKKRISELEADLEKRKDQVKDLEKKIAFKDECLEYTNKKLFERTRQCIQAQNNSIDFPATSKPEDKLF